MTRNTKKQYEAELARQAKDNPKKLWRYAKSKLKTKEGVANLVQTLEDGTEISSTTEVLSHYFSSEYTTEPVGPVPALSTYEITDPFTEEEITAEEVHKHLKSLNPPKSQGPDDIHRFVLKELAAVLAMPPGLYIYSTLLSVPEPSRRPGRLQTFLQSLKKANATKPRIIVQ